jgi:spermidine synthase
VRRRYTERGPADKREQMRGCRTACYPARMAATAHAGTEVVCDEAGALCLQFADGALQSRTACAEPTRLLLEYTRLMMGFLLFQPAPSRIAMLGLGGGSLAKYCVRTLPDTDFTAVEISPDVIALRDLFGVPPDGPRFRVVCDDGAAFVRRDAGPYDVLLVDGFDASGQPEELCSVAFYDACRDRLADDGVLVVNLFVDDGACEERLARLREAFDGAVAVVAADGSDNRVAFAAARRPVPPPLALLVERLRRLRSVHPVGLDVVGRKLLVAPSSAGRARRPAP